MKHVCHACIKDTFLSDEVRVEATPAPCSYCHETREAITLATLAERFHGTLQEHFYLTPDYPDEPYEYYQASEGDWNRRGEPAKYVIMDMADIAEEVAADATKLLSDEYGYWAIREEGREDPYGFDARYEEKAPDVQYFQDAWKKLRAAKTSRKHLFSPATEAVLSDIFGDLVTQSTILAQPVIRVINPGDADSRVWRGRPARPDGELEEILKHPAQELGPPRRTAPRVTVIGSQCFGRRPQVAWSNPPLLGVLHPGAIGQGQQGGHRQDEPVPGDAGGVGAPRLVPLPAQALEGLEAQLDPEAQGVPAGTHLIGCKVGEDDPGFLLFGVPDHQQGAAALGLGGAEGGAAANPRRIGTGDEALGGQSFAAVSAESDVLSVAHTGMPALIPYLLPQLGTGNAPVAEHDDGHILGNRWGQGLQQFHGGVHPGAGLVGVPDVPGHGDGATAVYHRHGGLVAFDWPRAVG